MAVRILVAFLVFIAPVLLGRAEAVGQEKVQQTADVVSLLEGELEIKNDGVYTKSHVYAGPNGIECRLIGVLPVGTQSYFDSVMEEIRACDYMIYEGRNGKAGRPPLFAEGISPEEARQTADAMIIRLLPGLNSDDVNRTFAYSYALAYGTGMQRLGLIHEHAAYRKLDLGRKWRNGNSGKNWYSGDSPFFEKGIPSDPSEVERLNKEAGLLDAEKKRQLVASLRPYIDKATNAGPYGFQDFADLLQLTLAERQVVNWTVPFAERRHRLMFSEVFDKILNGKSKLTIGIKYGPYHVSHLQKLLEERGFVRSKTIVLKSITF